MACQKQKSNKANSSNSYPPLKGYFRETYKSQNINTISQTPKITMGINYFSVLSSIINLSVQFQYQPDPEVRYLICNMTTLRKKMF